MSGRDLVSEMRDSGKAPQAPRSGGGLIDLVLLIVIVAAIGSLGYFGVTYWMSSGGPTAPPPALAMAIKADPAQAWTEDDSARCKAKASSAANASLPGEFALADRVVTEGFAGLATLVECQLSTKVARFCNPAEKAAAVALVNDYLGRIDLLQLGLGLQGAPMALMGELLGGEVAFGSAVYDMQREDTLKFMAGYHGKVAAKLQALTRDGIVLQADFAGPFGGVPENIKAMFGDAQPTRQACG